MCDVLDLLRRLECTGGVKDNSCPSELTDTHLPDNSTVNILATVGSIATHCTPKQLKIARAILQNVAKADPTIVLQNYNLALSRPSIMINDDDIKAFGNVIIPFTFVSEIIRSMTEAASSDDLLHLWFHLVFKSFVSSNESRRKFIKQLCIKIWNQNHYVQNRTLEYLKSSETSFQTLVLSSLISFHIKPQIGEDSSSLALLFVNNLLKALFSNKSHVPPLVPLCTGVIKHLVDPEMFKVVVMPALHRAILRSAEANMVGAAVVLRSVSFDLDFCADELVQPIVTHLCALSDSIRRSTVTLLCAIISRCSELDAITAVLKCIYTQITGPEGKKAGKDARLTGLTCLGEMCNHGAKRNAVSDAVGKTAVGLLVEFMEQETHDETLIYAAKQLTKWVCRFKTSLPERLMVFIKTKGFDTKTAPTVRCAYLACLDSAFTNVDIQDRLPSAVHASLLTTVERAIGQPNHSPVVFEAVCASLIWLRYFLAKAKRPLCHETIKSQLHTTPIWTLLVGTTASRRPWFSERFLQTAPDYILRKLAHLMELVLRELNPFIPDEALSGVYRNLVLLAIHPHYDSVRKPASDCVMSLIRKAPESDRWTFANRLLCDLSSCLAEGEEDNRFNKPIAEMQGVGINKTVHKSITNTVETVGPRVWNEVTTEHPDTNLPATKTERQRSPMVGSYVAKLVADLVRITSFCSDYCVNNERTAKKNPKDSSNIRKDLPVEYWRNVVGLYLASLLSASHTIIITGIPTLWERLRRYVGLPELADDPEWINFVGEDYLFSKWSELANYFANLSCLDQSHTVALRRLISWSPLKFGQALFSLIFSRLLDQKFVHASERDVHIMLTPASQLYNQDLLESLPKYQKSDTNVKRESKLYSYDVQLDIMTAKKQREEMLKKSILPSEKSLLDVLAEQLTDKQLESVRAELTKEAETRQRMFQADMEARHLTNLVTITLQTCALKSVCLSAESAPMVRELFNTICSPLSDLLVRLIASPLVAPYVLRTCVNGVTLAMLLCVNSVNGIDLEDCQLFAPLIGWWSVRILGPARLLHQSDIAVLTPSFCSSGKRLSLAQRYVLEQMVDNATSLTACWSEESIVNQTGRVLGFLTEKRNKNTTLLYAFLCPTFEYLLLASGWAQPLLEELSNLPFPSLLSDVHDIKETGTNEVISPVVRKKWDWVTSQYVKDLLTNWLHQLQSSVPGPNSFVSVAHREVVLHVLPFQHVFRLMRQVVDSMLGDLNPYSVGLDQQLMSDQDNDAETRFLVNEESEDRSSTSKALAQTALDVMRSAANLLAYELSGENISDALFCELANGVLRSLLMGIVSETAQAREICLTCILILIQKVPSLVEKVLKAQPEPSFTHVSNVDANVGRTPDLAGEADDALDLETVTEASIKNVAENKPKKKLNKNQRRKQKQAQMVADLLKEQGDGDVLSMPYETPAFWPSLPLWPTLQVRIWIARSDLSSEVAVLAERLWFLFGLDVACEQPVIEEENQESSLVRLCDTPTTSLMKPMVLAQRLLLETTRPVASVQKATADAFALCLMGRSADELAVALGQLVHLYKVMLHRDPPVKDSVGRILVPESADRWRERVGLAFALARLSESPNLSVKTVRSLRKGLSAAKAEPIDMDRERPITTITAVTQDSTSSDKDADRSNRADLWLLEMFRFLVPDGLNDRNSVVQSVMLQAGLNAVSIYGRAHFGQLLPILETFLNKAPNVAELDAVRQSVLILTGSLSQNLAADDPKVWNIFNRLITTLNFPSDVVQQAVEDCLASLVTKLSEEQKTKTIARLMSTLLGSPVYAERHGAAHGIAGIASGLGIMSLKHYGIIEKLIPALEDTKSSKRREGALLAIERLCLGLGRLFEPYIIRLISGLLTAFGDTSPSVREAASNTARAIMCKLSAHGVRLILPALLRAIDSEQSWRTKAQSVELLATMTHCAPKQLSACLPQIVPRLLEVLVTSQEQLKQAGLRALKQIGSVIRNPEVQALVPLLTSCLQDPLADKMPCLLALRDTCFVHVLDAPSLALIVPVIQRAFADRSTEARKTAAQIFGNLHSLARKEELQPYVANIMPPLKACLLDAVPDIRSVAAAALGALVRGMGESCFTEVLPWLITTMTSETSSVDRSGAAQGLAEVLGAMGIERLRSILPDLVRAAASGSKIPPHVRDGYLMLFIYLPAIFQDAFCEFIGPIIPTILKSLSDETEYLRETALRAAQQIVQMFAESSFELLLPELEQGVGDPNWRIRHSSVQLLGDLLYQLSGLSGKGTTKTQDEDDTFGTSAAHDRLKEFMGAERHDRVLARIHMVRSDPTLIVRQAAIHVWKVVVPNTSRTLREIMPVLIRLLLTTLGSSNREQQQVAARALGDVVRKLGERILPEVIPLLVHGLNSAEPDHRRGVCTGLMEIMRNCPREQLVNYIDTLIVPIRRTLCDKLPEIRRSGARTFELLYNTLGVRLLDSILPDLLVQLDDTEANPYVLDGIRQLLVVKGKAVMPYLVPKLIYPTVNVKVFAYLASVAGDALTRQLNRILPALLTTVSQLNGQPDEEEDLLHCASVLICIHDAGGIRYVFNTLLSGLVLGVTPSAPSLPNQVTPGTLNYRLACLRLLNAYLEVSYESTDGPIEVTSAEATQKGAESINGENDDENDDDDDYSSEDYSDDEDESEDVETDSDMDNVVNDNDEEVPDVKETVSKILREFYPVALRNVCRLLSSQNEATLVYCWKCLESLFKRWSPESVTTQINDLRQGIREAIFDFRKTTRTKSGEEFLPGFSDPNLPLTSLIKLYADCTLHGRIDIREPAAQALCECISHASGVALQGCVVKVIGPLIRLLGERQTSVVRMALVESLTSLIHKCPKSARPFVIQLQTTILKCLGDPHRPMRLLGGKGLASLVGITSKLDPLLIDLAQIPAHSVITHWPGETYPGMMRPDSSVPSAGAATALTSTGIATYPETSFYALRLCLIGSFGKAGIPALKSVLNSLLSMMYIQDTGLSQMNVVDDDVDEEDEEDATYLVGRTQKFVPLINADSIRIVASSCIGCVIASIDIALRSQSEEFRASLDPVMQPSRILEQLLFENTTNSAHHRWYFRQSQAAILLTCLKYSPDALISEKNLQSGLAERLERFITQTCAHEQSAVSQLGFRCVGVYVGHIVESPQLNYDLNPLMQLLIQGIKHELIDIRLLTTVVLSHIAWRWKLLDPQSSSSMRARHLSTFLSIVITGSRDKASTVRLGSESALAVLCRFGTPNSKESNSAVQICLETVDSGNRSSLDALVQRLRKQSWLDIWSQGCPDMDSTSMAF